VVTKRKVGNREEGKRLGDRLCCYDRDRDQDGGRELEWDTRTRERGKIATGDLVSIFSRDSHGFHSQTTRSIASLYTSS